MEGWQFSSVRNTNLNQWISMDMWIFQQSLYVCCLSVKRFCWGIPFVTLRALFFNQRWKDRSNHHHFWFPKLPLATWKQAEQHSQRLQSWFNLVISIRQWPATGKKNRHEYIISELGITNPGLKFVGFIDVSCSKTDLFSRYWEQKKSGVAPPKKEFAKQDCRKEWDTVYKNHNWDTELDHHQYQNESFLGKRHHDPSWIQDISPGKYSPTFYKVFFCR